MTTSTLAAATITRQFLDRAEKMPTKTAFQRKVNGRWEPISWKGYADAVRKIGQGLLELGLQKGDKVGILSNTRAEWCFCDLGILCAGGTTVPIYQSNLPGEVQYILEDSGARYLFVEDLDQWKKVRDRLDQLAAVEKVVIFDPSDTESTTAKDAPFDVDKAMTFDQLLELGEGAKEQEAAFEAASQNAALDDVVTLIYTSGTTGKPKGVILTHKQAAAECKALSQAIYISENDITLAFLPLAHVFARALHWAQITIGYEVAFAESVTAVLANMGEIRPTFFAAVPRVYEKIHAAVSAQINAKGAFMRGYIYWALENAVTARTRRDLGQGAGMAGVKAGLGKPALGKLSGGLKAKVGGRLKFFISGGAPLSREIAGFFRVLGLTIYEGYGLTETTAATHINTPDAYRLGTVGKPVVGCEQRIAPDGEILLKGDVIMPGYHNRPDASAEVLKDGWFHTGDIGEIDEDGFLKITDRKKDLIITAAGKNIAPQTVENHVKTHRFVSQVCLFGDRRKFCVALLTIDEEAVRKELADQGTSAPESLAELVKLDAVKQLLQTAIDEKNQDLPSYETIKYFELLPAEFEVGDELTPSLKVKRKHVAQKYAAIVDQLYAAHGG